MRRKGVVVLAVLSILIFVGVVFGIVVTTNSIKIKSHKINLDKGWEYSLASADILPNAEFSILPPENYKSLQELVPGKSGFIFLRQKFDLPLDLKDKDLNCYLGRVSMSDSTSINGNYIGNTGRFPPKTFSAWNCVRNYSVSKTVLKNSGNVLLVKLYVEGEGAISDNAYIGLPEDAKKSAAREQFFNSKLYLLFAFSMIVMAVYFFVIFLNRHKERESLFFAIVNALSAMYMFVFCLYEIPGLPDKNASFLIYQKIFSGILPFLIMFSVTSFINAFVERKERKAMLVLRYIFLIAPIVIISIAPNYVRLVQIRAWTNFFLIPPIAYILLIVISSIIKRRRDTVILLAGFSPVVFCAIIDYFLGGFFDVLKIPCLTLIGWQVGILAFFLILAVRFSSALNDTEYLNRHLGDEVTARTNELSFSNEKLTQTNSELETARFVEEKDMKLAVYVQQSFFNTPLLQFSDWEIAMHFKPVAGLSGDLYDFFVADGKLKGIGLFDVSGDGIAPGLFTLMAKKIIDNKFAAGAGKPLPKIMSEINDKIIEEKRDIENYLTGVLLRVDGDKVEYINAEHTKSFFRIAKTAKALPIERKGGASSFGSFIGIAGLPVEYPGLTFKMGSGDALIIYTDCFNKSLNLDGEDFGFERIQEEFRRNTGKTAQEKLDFMLKSFNDFTKGVPQKDDLTVIVLQRK